MIELKSKPTVSCIWCLYIYDWTWIDASRNTMIKHMQDNSKFLDADFRECNNCVPKRKLSVRSWTGLNEYYKQRGIIK